MDPATTFTDSLLFHLTNLSNIEARQQAFPEKPLSQSHHRSLSRSFKFASHWHAAIALPQFSGGITNHPPRELPRTSDQCERWFESLAVRIFHICNNHMRAAHELLKNDPLRTSTMTDLNFDSLLQRVSSLDGFFTFAQQTTEAQARSTADAGIAGVEALGVTNDSACDSDSETPAPTPSRVPHSPAQGRPESSESEEATINPHETPIPPAPSESTGTRNARGMAAQPVPNLRHIEQAFLAARKNHPDPIAFSAEYIDNLIAIFEAGEAEEAALQPAR